MRRPRARCSAPAAAAIAAVAWIAKTLGLHLGAGYAWGPEDDYFYVTIGNAWY